MDKRPKEQQVVILETKDSRTRTLLEGGKPAEKTIEFSMGNMSQPKPPAPKARDNGQDERYGKD